MNRAKIKAPYSGFEQGPIRPPSEASSLLIRVTRNCPWNRCTFCPVYKRSKFSLRPVDHVKKDIDTVHEYIEKLRRLADSAGHILRTDINRLFSDDKTVDLPALNAAYHWYMNGMQAIFLQDANSLIIKPHDLVEILMLLKKYFPWVERITSYARSQTIARIKDSDLSAMCNAGLNRIHIGLESGSDRVLAMVKKGVTKETHIKAGRKVKKAGMQLSEYVMPGLGGKQLSKVHALETADALNRIDPDFIRLRTLAVPDHIELFQDVRAERFEKCTDRMIVEEILLFIQNLAGVSSTVKSDHILNLFQDVEGKLPQDKEKMTAPLRAFLKLNPQDRVTYQIGRRMGLFAGLQDMQRVHRRAKVEETCRQLDVTPDNVDEIVDQLMKRFI